MHLRELTVDNNSIRFVLQMWCISSHCCEIVYKIDKKNWINHRWIYSEIDFSTIGKSSRIEKHCVLRLSLVYFYQWKLFPIRLLRKCRALSVEWLAKFAFKKVKGALTIQLINRFTTHFSHIIFAFSAVFTVLIRVSKLLFLEVP